MRRWWRGHSERRACGNVVEPSAQLRVPRPPAKIGIPSFEPEGSGECDLRQIECAAHQRMVDLCLPEVSDSSAAVCFVLENSGRTFILGPQDLATPNCESVQHASRQGFETARLPRLVSGWQIEGWVAIEVIEVSADDCGFLQPHAVVTDEIGNATRWINGVVGTVRKTCLCGDDLDSALQPLLMNHDACDARVGRARGDVELHDAKSSVPETFRQPRPRARSREKRGPCKRPESADLPTQLAHEVGRGVSPLLRSSHGSRSTIDRPRSFRRVLRCLDGPNSSQPLLPVLSD